MSEAAANGGTGFRLSSLERRVDRLENYDPGALAERVTNLSDDVRALKRAFYTFAAGAVTSSVVFAFTVFALLGKHP